MGKATKIEKFDIREKGWVWKLTGPFASNNYTLISPTTLYVPKGKKRVPKSLLRHESVHARQMREVGVLKYLFLYLICLPVFFNKWRWKWEWEAYREGSGLSAKNTRQLLRSSMYGWLRNG